MGEINFFPDDLEIKDQKIKALFKILLCSIFLEPNVKIMKTQDSKSIFIEVGNEGWKFTCNNHEINLETGLYFGKKNSYIENKILFPKAFKLEKKVSKILDNIAFHN